MTAFSGVLQFVAHIGEELRLGAVGGFGLRLLFMIAFGEVGELLRLRLERAARLAQLRDGGEQQALRFHQLVFVLFQRGDVRAHRDEAAVARAPFAHLQPARILELDFVDGAFAVGERGDLRRRRLDRRRAMRHDRRIGLAGADRVRGQIVQPRVFRVAQHKPILGVPQHEGFRNALDRLAQALVGLVAELRRRLLGADVDDRADEPAPSDARADDDLGMLAKPDPLAVAAAQAELAVDRAVGGGRGGDARRRGFRRPDAASFQARRR